MARAGIGWVRDNNLSFAGVNIMFEFRENVTTHFSHKYYLGWREPFTRPALKSFGACNLSNSMLSGLLQQSIFVSIHQTFVISVINLQVCYFKHEDCLPITPVLRSYIGFHILPGAHCLVERFGRYPFNTLCDYP